MNSNALPNSIDIDAFERGELALIATDNPDLFPNVNEIIISPSNQGENNPSGSQKITIPLGGFVPFDYQGIGSGLAPTVLVSNTLMREWFGEPVISRVNLDVSDDYEQNALAALKQITSDDYGISLTSKMESLGELQGAKMVLMILGGGIALVIALIGVLNFVNVMAVSIMVRRRELATLESVGMGRRQVRNLLTYEGLGYAAITLILVLSVGNAMAYGIFKLFQEQVSFAAFIYPFVPMAIVILAVLAVCFITPQILYHSIGKATIVERLREAAG
jgi:putative ABC transport system permease protein